MATTTLTPISGNESTCNGEVNGVENGGEHEEPVAGNVAENGTHGAEGEDDNAMDTGEDTKPTINTEPSTEGMSVDAARENDAPAADVAVKEEPVAEPEKPILVRPKVTKPKGGNLPLLEQVGKLVIGPGGVHFAQIVGLNPPKLRRRDLDTVERMKKYAMEQSVKHVMAKQTTEHQENQARIAMYSQSLSLMARIYCGAVPYELREDGLREMFSPFGPVKSINMTYDAMSGTHKGFAFLEFEVPESAVIAIEQMHGALAFGKNIKVGKPTNLPQNQPVIDQIIGESSAHHRVFVASVHPDLSEAELKDVFSAFGTITDCTLAKLSNATKQHRGYGYITFTTAQSAVDAVASMNMFDLGGQYLRVGRAITPPWAQVFNINAEASNLPTASAIAAIDVAKRITAANDNNGVGGFSPLATSGSSPRLLPVVPLSQSVPAIEAAPSPLANEPLPPTSSGRPSKFGEKATTVPPPSVIVPKIAPQPAGDGTAKAHYSVMQQNMLMHKLMNNGTVSRVLCLRNMVQPGDVDEHLSAEIKEECSKFGQVEDVIVYEDRFGPAPNAVQIKIFVKFSKQGEAEMGMSKMDGRYFDGKTIRAAIYDEAKFDQNDYTA